MWSQKSEVWGEKRGAEKKRQVQQKDKSEITLHKGSKGSINITLAVSHSDRQHYKDRMMKVVVEWRLTCKISNNTSSLMYQFSFALQWGEFCYSIKKILHIYIYTHTHTDIKCSNNFSCTSALYINVCCSHATYSSSGTHRGTSHDVFKFACLNQHPQRRVSLPS